MIIVGYQGYVNGFEFKDGEWRRTPAAIFHLMFW